MEINQIKENKLKMILQFSIPSIIAMLLQTVVTITDGYFTGNYVGGNALAAINLGLPILYFYLGVGLCVGVGGSVISGRFFGAGETKKASEVFSQTMATTILTSVTISVVVSALFTPILTFLGADGELTTYFTEYYRIMLFTYPLLVIGTVLGMFIRVAGKPQICMLVSMGGCILNVILDYIFVAVMGLGIQGSAIATFMTQVLSVAIQLTCFMQTKARIRFCRFAFDRTVFTEMFLNGSSEFIGEMASAISMFAFNFVRMKYVGAEGVTAFGILFAVGVLTAISFFVMGRSYAGMFGCSSNVADMVASGFKIYALTFLVMGYDVTNSMYFTSCGDAKSSALISALRGIVLLLAFTLILPAILGMTGVWMTAPCSETLTAIVSTFLIIRQKEKIKYEADRR